MIEIQKNQAVWSCVLTPNHSFTWNQNKQFLILIGCIYSVISGVCWYLGLWPVLFFSGVDILVLFAAFYWVARKNMQQIVIHISEEFIDIQSGYRHIEQHIQFPRAWTQLSVSFDSTHNEITQIQLRYTGQTVELAGFLNQADRKKLCHHLHSFNLN